MRTLKRFGYWSQPPVPKYSRKARIIAAHNGDYEHKKSEITRSALEHMYAAPHFREQKQITPRQMRLKMILVEALDIAHSICEHQDARECLWAWEMVDEIDDAAGRAGVYHR